MTIPGTILALAGVVLMPLVVAKAFRLVCRVAESSKRVPVVASGSQGQRSFSEPGSASSSRASSGDGSVLSPVYWASGSAWSGDSSSSSCDSSASDGGYCGGGE